MTLHPFLLSLSSLLHLLLSSPIPVLLSCASLFLLFLLLSLPPFHQVLQSSEINLQLAKEEVATLQEVIQPDPSSGQIPYGEFATHAADVIASLYQNQPASDVSARGCLASFPGLAIVQSPILQYEREAGNVYKVRLGIETISEEYVEAWEGLGYT